MRRTIGQHTYTDAWLVSNEMDRSLCESRHVRRWVRERRAMSLPPWTIERLAILSKRVAVEAHRPSHPRGLREPRLGYRAHTAQERVEPWLPVAAHLLLLEDLGRLDYARTPRWAPAYDFDRSALVDAFIELRQFLASLDSQVILALQVLILSSRWVPPLKEATSTVTTLLPWTRGQLARLPSLSWPWLAARAGVDTDPPTSDWAWLGTWLLARFVFGRASAREVADAEGPRLDRDTQYLPPDKRLELQEAFLARHWFRKALQDFPGAPPKIAAQGVSDLASPVQRADPRAVCLHFGPVEDDDTFLAYLAQRKVRSFESNLDFVPTDDAALAQRLYNIEPLRRWDFAVTSPIDSMRRCVANSFPAPDQAHNAITYARLAFLNTQMVPPHVTESELLAVLASCAEGLPGDGIGPERTGIPDRTCRNVRLMLARAACYPAAELLHVAWSAFERSRPYFAYEAVAGAWLHPHVPLHAKHDLARHFARIRFEYRRRAKVKLFWLVEWFRWLQQI